MWNPFRLGVILTILVAAAFGQDRAFSRDRDRDLPSAPSETKAEFAVLTAEIIADGVSTRILYQRGCGENDPLARPFVRAGVGGQVAGSFLGLAAAGGAWVILHRTHHDRVAKWMLRSAVAAEGVNDIRQFKVMTECR